MMKIFQEFRSCFPEEIERKAKGYKGIEMLTRIVLNR